MNLDQLIEFVRHDTVDVSLPAFRPELTLSVTIVIMLLVRLFDWGRRVPASALALAGSVVALYFSAPWLHLSELNDLHVELFTGMLIYDKLTIFIRSLLLFFAVAFVILTMLSGIPDREDGPDFYTLVLGGTVGMCLMASANHLLMVFLAVEMASVPSYALAGLLKGRRKSSEAALKYAVFGAGTAGIMLYGISLLAGVLGSAHLPSMAFNLAEMLQTGLDPGRTTVLALAGLMVMVGLAFKLSAVPFHFWCPDVFEGASAEVNAFLSVASKAAALGLLVRVALGFSYVPEPRTAAQPPAQVAALYSVADQIPPAADPGAAATEGHTAPTAVPADSHATPVATHTEPLSPAAATRALAPVRQYLVSLIAFLAAITCTFGNLAAYGQTNIKRLLAYSTIAHAGYMMMPVAAAVALVGRSEGSPVRLFGQSVEIGSAEGAIAALAFYTATYLFMNLGAFAVVAFLRNAMRSEEIEDYAGLLRRCPGVVICFSIILLSLIGMPPMCGFIAKFLVFGFLVPSGLLWLLVIGGLNTAISLFYYLRIIKTMTLDPEPDHRLPVNLSLLSRPGLYVAFLTVWVVVLGVWFNWLNEWALTATHDLFS